MNDTHESIPEEMASDQAQTSHSQASSPRDNEAEPSVGSILRKIKHPEAPSMVDQSADQTQARRKPPAAKSETTDPVPEPKPTDKADSDDSDNSDNHWQDLLSKKDKSFRDTQKWGMQAHNKLKAYEQRVKQYQEEGVLSEEEAKALLETATHPDLSSDALPPVVRYGHIFDNELPAIRRYSTDADDLDAHVLAFQMFLQMAPTAEVDEVIHDLQAHESDPVQLTKAMLSYGRRFYNETLKAIVDAGGIRSFKDKYEKDLAMHQKTIDKLKKELAQLKDQEEELFDPNRVSYDLPPGQSSKAPEIKERSMGSLLDRARKGQISFR